MLSRQTRFRYTVSYVTVSYTLTYLPVCGLPAIILAILTESSKSLFDRLRSVRQNKLPICLVFLTLSWLKPRDSCELGLLALGRCLKAEASHIEQAIPDCRSVLDSLVIFVSLLFFSIEPQGFVKDVQRSVHVPGMRGSALLAHPFAFGQLQLLVLVSAVVAEFGTRVEPVHLDEGSTIPFRLFVSLSYVLNASTCWL